MFVTLGNDLPCHCEPRLVGRGNLIAKLEPAMVGLRNIYIVISLLSLANSGPVKLSQKPKGSDFRKGIAIV